jgi:aryl-alcohol dehydrogenase-like predicted oxidoreductase
MACLQEAVIEYEKVAAKHGLTPSELALGWCKSRCVQSLRGYVL